MPRHDRAHGITVPTKRSGGGGSRRTRSPKNTYRAKQNRRSADGPTETQTAKANPAAEAQAAQGRK